MTRNVQRWFAAAGVVLAAAAPAHAQTPAPAVPATQPARPARPFDISLAVQLDAPISFGSSAVEFLRPDGSVQTIFRTESSRRVGRGLAAHIGFPVRGKLWAEVSGGWSAADLQSTISGDIEDGGSDSLRGATHRFVLEGAGRWDLVTRGKMVVFARGSVGWMRELAGDGALVEDGRVVSAGLGLRRWWREQRTARRTRRIGLRVDGRVDFLSSGLTLGDTGVRVGPSVSGGLIFGF